MKAWPCHRRFHLDVAEGVPVEAIQDVDPGRLSPIIKESDASSATDSLVHEDPEFQKVLDTLQDDLSAVMEEVPPGADQEEDRSERLPLAYLQHSYLDMCPMQEPTCDSCQVSCTRCARFKSVRQFSNLK